MLCSKSHGASLIYILPTFLRFLISGIAFFPLIPLVTLILKESVLVGPSLRFLNLS